MEYCFCFDFLYLFLHYIHMVLHLLRDSLFPYILQKKRMKIDQVRAELHLPNTVGVKFKSCRNSLSCKLNYIDCIGVKKV